MAEKKGCFRRFITLSNRNRQVTGYLEDDFHHFLISLEHNGCYVTDIRAEVLRHPWSTCPGAIQPLKELIGKRLISRPSDIGQLIDMRIQCTHLFDLAGLMLVHAFGSRNDRSYEIVVPDREVIWDERGTTPKKLGPTMAKLFQNKAEVLYWEIDNREIVGPESHPRIFLDEGFRSWTETLTEDLAERAGILRRAVMVASGRMLDLGQFETADELARPPVCHTFQLDNAPKALKMINSQRDFSES